MNNYFVLLLLPLITCAFSSKENSIGYKISQYTNQNITSKDTFYNNLSAKQSVFGIDLDKAFLKKNLKKSFVEKKSNILSLHTMFTYQLVYGASTMIEQKQFDSLIIKDQEEGSYQVLYSYDLSIGGSIYHMLFTTYSNIFFVRSDQCNNCYNRGQEGKTYHCTDDKCSKESKRVVSTQNENSFIDGYITKDSLSIGDINIEAEFLSVYNQENIEYELGGFYKGVIGFGAEKKGSLINQMYMQKKIQKNLFCVQVVFMGDIFNYSPQITIGEYSSQYSNFKVHYFRLVDKNQWTIALHDATFNGMAIFNSQIESRKLIMALNFNSILVPQNDFDKIVQILFDLKFKRIGNNQLIYECSEKNYDKSFPTMSFTLKDENNKLQTYNLLPIDYVKSLKDNECILTIQRGNNQEWLIGNIFMIENLIVFNYEKEAIGIISKEKLVNPSLNSNMVFAYIGIIIIVFGVYCIIHIVKQMSNKSSEEEENEIQLISLNNNQY